jgi:enoyl-[acyl-carrier-protein] reductase (NADH)
MGVGWGSAARRLVWRKELVHALGFSPRQQSDGREQQTNENDFLHVLACALDRYSIR